MLVEERNDELAAAAAEIQEQLLSDWMAERQQAVRQELKYGSALLTYIERFLKRLDASRYAALRLGAWLGTVESLERFQYEQNQAEWAEERFAKAYVKHLPEVVKTLETHGVMSHTELSELLDMKVSTLTEAMKKIVDTGAVQAASVGKYKLYSLSDEGLRYGKELRKRQAEACTLTEVCEKLDMLLKEADEPSKRQWIETEVLSMLGSAENLNICRGDMLRICDVSCSQKLMFVLQAESSMNVVGSSEKILIGRGKNELGKVRNTRAPEGSAWTDTTLPRLKLASMGNAR